MSINGASAKGTIQSSTPPSVASATPIAPSEKSIQTSSSVKRPVCRGLRRRADWSMAASRTRFTTRNVTVATKPPTTSSTEPAAWAAHEAVRAETTKFEMLKTWMYQR